MPQTPVRPSVRTPFRVLAAIIGIMAFLSTTRTLLSDASTCSPITSDEACRILKKTFSAAEDIPASGPMGFGWFCDLANGGDNALYVIALRSNRPAPYSNLMGWYAVRRQDGFVTEWDVTNLRVGPAISLDASKSKPAEEPGPPASAA
jgi:hypothetical protein